MPPLSSPAVPHKNAPYFLVSHPPTSPSATHIFKKKLSTTATPAVPSPAALVAALAAASAALPPAALAGVKDNHLLTGQLVSLVHPAIMFFLFGASGWAGWLGWQWRRTREIGGDIKALKASLPAPGPDGARPPSPALDAQIAGLEATRKELIKGNYRDEHASWGSVLLAVGVLIAIEGPINTYLRTGALLFLFV